MAENPENYDYHRGVQCCILKNGDYMDLKGTDLPVIHVKLTDEQVCASLQFVAFPLNFIGTRLAVQYTA